MEYKNLHRWDLSPKEAIALQETLRNKVKLQPVDTRKLRIIAGIDVSVKDNFSQAAIVLLSFPELTILKEVTHKRKTVFPYVPGLLSFREAPVILECVKKLDTTPDLFIFDGQGMAHPRHLGIASHVGLFLNKPCIGSAKSHLYGTFKMPGNKKGDFSLIRDIKRSNMAIGAVLRTRDNTNPIFVSPGHMADIDSSIKVILACSPKYKLPEPIRAAHKTAGL